MCVYLLPAPDIDFQFHFLSSLPQVILRDLLFIRYFLPRFLPDTFAGRDLPPLTTNTDCCNVPPSQPPPVHATCYISKEDHSNFKSEGPSLSSCHFFINFLPNPFSFSSSLPSVRPSVRPSQTSFLHKSFSFTKCLPSQTAFLPSGPVYGTSGEPAAPVPEPIVLTREEEAAMATAVPTEKIDGDSDCPESEDRRKVLKETLLGKHQDKKTAASPNTKLNSTATFDAVPAEQPPAKASATGSVDAAVPVGASAAPPTTNAACAGTHLLRFACLHLLHQIPVVIRHTTIHSLRQYIFDASMFYLTFQGYVSVTLMSIRCTQTCFSVRRCHHPRG
jgi:hypothetical protein